MHQLLVVDDEPDICDVIKAGFEAGGRYRVRCATNKSDAFAALRLERPEMALLDILMRENAGVEIAALAAELRVPVLRMSGHPQIVHNRRMHDLAVLAKPFRIVELMTKVDRLLAEAGELQREMAQHMRTTQLLVDAGAVAPPLAWHEAAARWERLCRRVLQDG